MTYRTSIYVDGFNLYFGALRHTSYKWLDLVSLCEKLLEPHNQISRVKYFTANVSPTASDPDKAIHQQSYLKALSTVTPTIEIIKGQFTTHQVTKKLVTPIGSIRHVEIYDRKEKGSDVNLAAHLLNDAWLDKFDCAIVVSADSDLAEAIRLVRRHHSTKVVGVFFPTRTNSKELTACATFVRRITTAALAASQMPPNIAGTKVHKPADW